MMDFCEQSQVAKFFFKKGASYAVCASRNFFSQNSSLLPVSRSGRGGEVVPFSCTSEALRGEALFQRVAQVMCNM
jgi:hypothetical protein